MGAPKCFINKIAALTSLVETYKTGKPYTSKYQIPSPSKLFKKKHRVKINIVCSKNGGQHKLFHS